MIIFLLLNLLDSIITYIGITTGVCEEANILLASLFNQNIFLGLGVKMLLALGIAILIKKWKPNLFKILNVIFILIVIWNFVWIIL